MAGVGGKCEMVEMLAASYRLVSLYHRHRSLADILLEQDQQSR